MAHQPVDKPEERASYVLSVPGLDDGTEITLYAPSEGEAVVMGRAAFDLVGRGTQESRARSFLSLARMLDRLIVNMADKVMIEDLISSGEVGAEKIMELVPDLLRVHAEAVQEAPTTGPVANGRRVRRT